MMAAIGYFALAILGYLLYVAVILGLAVRW